MPACPQGVPMYVCALPLTYKAKGASPSQVSAVSLGERTSCMRSISIAERGHGSDALQIAKGIVDFLDAVIQCRRMIDRKNRAL